MLKTIALRSTLILTLTAFLAPSSRMLHAQPVDPPQTNAVTGGDPQPTGEPPKPKGNSVTDPTVLDVLIALGLA